MNFFDARKKDFVHGNLALQEGDLVSSFLSFLVDVPLFPTNIGPFRRQTTRRSIKRTVSGTSYLHWGVPRYRNHQKAGKKTDEYL